MSLTIEEDKVLEAVNKCPQAKEVLKTLFPSAFCDFNLEIIRGDSHSFRMCDLPKVGLPSDLFQINNTKGGGYRGKAFYIRGYDSSWHEITWELKPVDGEASMLLIPRKK